MLKIIRIISALIFLQTFFVYAQNGNVKTYYPDGKVESELSYVNDVLDGAVVKYYPNGNLMIEKNYSSGILNGWIREFFQSGLLKEEYLVKNGLRDGAYRMFYDNGSLKLLANYSDGNQTETKFFDYDKNYHAPAEAFLAGRTKQNEIPNPVSGFQCDVDICPEPIGGMKAIQDNLVYPEHALRYGLEGIVIITATINEQGEVEKTVVVQGLGLGCDEAAQDIVKKTKFSPGMKAGKNVEANLSLKIEFRITDKKSLPVANEKGK